MLYKIEGEDYKDYNLPPTEEGVINKTLPLEIFQEVFSYLDLDNKGIQQASLMSPLWKGALDDSKRREILAIKGFANVLSENLDVKSYPEQKSKLSDMASSRDIFDKVSLLEMKENISKFEEEIKEVLLTISEDGLDKLFDSFKDINKPPLFYKFVFLSKKYKRLHVELNNQITSQASTVALLKEGAVPTEETLNLATFYRAAPETVKALLEAGAIPTEITLKNELSRNSTPETIFALLKAGVVPTEETLHSAIEWWAEHEVIEAFLKAGVVPSEETIRLAENHPNPYHPIKPETVRALIEARAASPAQDMMVLD